MEERTFDVRTPVLATLVAPPPPQDTDTFVTDKDKRIFVELRDIPTRLETIYKDYVEWEKNSKKAIPPQLLSIADQIKQFYYEDFPIAIQDSLQLAVWGRQLGQHGVDLCRHLGQGIEPQMVDDFLESTTGLANTAIVHAEVTLSNLRRLRVKTFQIIQAIEETLKTYSGFWRNLTTIFTGINSSLQALRQNTLEHEHSLSSLIAWWIRIHVKLYSIRQTFDHAGKEVDSIRQNMVARYWVELVEHYTTYILCIERLKDLQEANAISQLFATPARLQTTKIFGDEDGYQIESYSRKWSDGIMQGLRDLELPTRTDHWLESGAGHWSALAVQVLPGLLQVGQVLEEFRALFVQTLTVAQNTTQEAHRHIQLLRGTTFNNDGIRLASELEETRGAMLNLITSFQMENGRLRQIEQAFIEACSLRRVGLYSRSKAIFVEIKGLLSILPKLVEVLLEWWSEVDIYYTSAMVMLRCSSLTDSHKRQALWTWLTVKSFHEGFICSMEQFRTHNIKFISFPWVDWSRNLERNAKKMTRVT